MRTIFSNFIMDPSPLFLCGIILNLRIPSIDAALLDLGISFFQFSYFGLIDLDQISKIDTPKLYQEKE